jgi:hypothetical protein
MTKRQRKQIVEVAMDVLESLGTLHVERGQFCYSEVPVKEEKTAKKTAQVLKKTCQVCAVGALFLSTVAMKNKFEFKLDPDGIDLDFSVKDLINRLLPVFPAEQLFLIENAFETGGGSFSTPYDSKYFLGLTDLQIEDLAPSNAAAIKFGSKYKTDKGRLKAILNNIIANDGEFIP